MRCVDYPGTVPARVARRGVTATLIGLASIVATAVGCGNLEPIAPAEGPITDPAQLYMRLELDHPAITLDTATGYNTLQLTATPLDAHGAPLNGLPTPTYTSSDTASVLVTADGVIIAKRATAGLTIVAELVVGPVRHADTAIVDVTTEVNPPKLTTFEITPDSAVWSVLYWDHYEYNKVKYLDIARSMGIFSGMLKVNVRVVTVSNDADGNTMNPTQIEYRSLDPKIATVDRRSGEVTRSLPGQVRMVARTTAYGISKADTLAYTVTPLALRTISIHPALNGTPVFGWHEIVIPPYGIVLWANYLQDSADVTFDGPVDMATPPEGFCGWVDLLAMFGTLLPSSSCGTGNALFEPAGTAIDEHGMTVPAPAAHVRQFPTPGIYGYRSTRTGATGRIVVADID